MRQICVRLFWLLMTTAALGISANSQSTDQNFPTPVTASSIEGKIKVRDIGDSRSTTHFYLIQGDRGDVFINIVTSNIDGSIDIFSKVGLRPKTKITLFSDNPDSETGRVIYLRESEQLVLRIQGRAPGETDGSYQIKFAGSFRAMADDGSSADPFADRVAGRSGNVNAAGVIVPGAETPEPKAEDVEKPSEKRVQGDSDVGSKVAATKDIPTESSAIKETETVVSKSSQDKNDSADSPPSNPASDDTKNEDAEKKDGEKTVFENPRLRVVTTPVNPVKDEEKKAADNEDKNGVEKKGDEKAENVTVEISDEKPRRSAIVRIERSREEPDPKALEKEKLEKTNLVVEFSNGGKFVRPMNEVVRFSVDDGQFTVITTDGQIRRFSILEVSKVSIEERKDE